MFSKKKKIEEKRQITLRRAKVQYQLIGGTMKEVVIEERVVGYNFDKWWTTDIEDMVEKAVHKGFWCQNEYFSPNSIYSAVIVDDTTFSIDEPDNKF